MQLDSLCCCWSGQRAGLDGLCAAVPGSYAAASAACLPPLCFQLLVNASNNTTVIASVRVDRYATRLGSR
jgi:hypothetical protein